MSDGLCGGAATGLSQDTLELIMRQLEIERKAVVEGDLLVRTRGPDPDDIASVSVYQHGSAHLQLFGEDVSPDQRATLRRLGAARAFTDQRAVEAVIGPREREHFRIYTFDRSAPAAGVVAEDNVWSLYHGEVLASRAFSSREGRRAAELAVETKPPFRRRGFARRVACAWADAQLTQGRIAFYSHAVSNAASQALATSLPVTERFEVVTYTALGRG